uniref:Uncharacterized protein n=1 Tax=Leersia perrieri TaxID=77586 RepID=A0A0D9WNC8_9ORYZ
MLWYSNNVAAQLVAINRAFFAVANFERSYVQQNAKMASCIFAGQKSTLLWPVVVLLILQSMAANALSDRRQLQLMEDDPASDVLSYHGGAVLAGEIPVSIVWYGKFKPSQKDIVVDFVQSLTPTTTSTSTPSAAQWWRTLATSYLSNATTVGNGSGAKAVATRVVPSNQVSDEAYSLGKTLTLAQISQLAAGASPKRGAVVLVLTDADVVVEGFCSVRCGVHGSDAGAGYAYAWAGNAERQCPGQCARPFARPAYGPQDPPLGAPNGEVGVDGMVVTLASMVAGAVTNPFGDAYYQGDKDAALEACTACAGVYGSGSYPGYAGKVLVDKANGGSYNAVGGSGKRFLLPAIYIPATASCFTTVVAMVALVVLSLAGASMAARRQLVLLKSHVSDELSYHGGAVLHGDIPVTIVWYGRFKPAQKAIVVDFLLSLTPTSPAPTNAMPPSAAQWWSTIAKGYLSSNATAAATRVVLANQTTDEEYSLGKSLTLVEVFQLAAGIVPDRGDLVVVLTDADVVVEGFCSARCGVHGSDARAGYAYAWAGDAERQCPGQCAWPFATPAYGPKDPALVPPNGDVGMDGMVATLAGVLAGAVTNPFGDGYYLGDRDAALEACSACAGAYGSGSYPGYAGKVLVDETTGGSYNAVGANGRKYLLPAVYDPVTSRCTTLV